MKKGVIDSYDLIKVLKGEVEMDNEGSGYFILICLAAILLSMAVYYY